MSAYGSKLDPYRKLREPLGVKVIRQSVVVTNNPSTIDQNQQLLVRFPNLSTNDVIVPQTARLAFTIELTSKDPNATVYQNLGRAIVKKTTIKINGNEVMSIDDSDIFHCYVDLWKSPSERMIWLVGCVRFNGPLRQYFSLYRAVSQREGERRERIDESKNVQTTPTRTYCKRNRPLPYCNQNCRTPRHWKLI